MHAQLDFVDVVGMYLSFYSVIDLSSGRRRNAQATCTGEEAHSQYWDSEGKSAIPDEVYLDILRFNAEAICFLAWQFTCCADLESDSDDELSRGGGGWGSASQSTKGRSRR